MGGGSGPEKRSVYFFCVALHPVYMGGVDRWLLRGMALHGGAGCGGFRAIAAGSGGF